MPTPSDRGRRGEVYLVTSGDLRLSANQACWPAQQDLEERLTARLRGSRLQAHARLSGRRRHRPRLHLLAAHGHGHLHDHSSSAKLVFATAAWQYSHHVLPGLRSHRGPILTVANWSGQWPGLVGLLNLNGSLTKAGVPFSSLWSRDFTDDFFLNGLAEWLRTGHITHDREHIEGSRPPRSSRKSLTLGKSLAADLMHRKAILGIFDEGCMGMYNAIIDDELLNPAGIFKERLSQSALVARMRTVPSMKPRPSFNGSSTRGVTFELGSDPATELTRAQVLEQCKMYIAAIRIAADFGCDAIGIQYQQGLKDMVPASDLVEGLLNNAERPPVYAEGSATELYPGGPLPHFNEVDECAGVDALITNRVWTALGMDPSTTLHDIRWGEHYKGPSPGGRDLRRVRLAPPNLRRRSRQPLRRRLLRAQPPPASPPCTSRSVGARSKASASPAASSGAASSWKMAPCTATSASAPRSRCRREETERRWHETTYQWPIVHAIFAGVTRDQFMARHRANHVNIAYAPTSESASHALSTKAAMLHALGITVHLCGKTTT